MSHSAYEQLGADSSPMCPVSSCDNSHYEKVGGDEPVCIDDELPFELPDGWEWARLNSAVVSVADGDHQPPPQSPAGIPFLVISNVATGTLSFNDTRYVSRNYYDSLGEYRKPMKNDVLYTVTGSYGITLVVPDDRPFCVQRHIGIIRPSKSFSSGYLCRCLQSGWIKSCADVVATGIAQKTVGLNSIRGFLVPIPPLAEQRRIVDALDEYLGLVDEIERSQAELESLLAKARSKVLDLAIRGKLVAQDPADEPASVLLERIRAEKLQMVADGRLKKKDIARDSVIYRGEDNSYYEKVGGDEPVCIDDELPFELPSSWAWSRLVSLCHPQEKPQMATETFGYIDIDSIDNKRNVVKQPKKIATKNAPSRANRRLRSGATLFSMVRPYLRNIANIDDNLSDCIASTGFYIASPIVEGNLSSWLFLYMRSDCFVDTINRQMRGDNSPSVRKDEMDSMFIPLPPESEQNRAFGLAQRVLTLLEDW